MFRSEAEKLSQHPDSLLVDGACGLKNYRGKQVRLTLEAGVVLFVFVRMRGGLVNLAKGQRSMATMRMQLCRTMRSPDSVQHVA